MPLSKLDSGPSQTVDRAHAKPAAPAAREGRSAVIADRTVQEAFTRAFAAGQKAAPLPADVKTPADLIYRDPAVEAGRARDREAQQRQDSGWGKARKRREVITYPDPPASAGELLTILRQYDYCFGDVRRFPVNSMVQLGMPLVVWQQIFTRVRGQIEGGYKAGHPGLLCLDIGKKEQHYVRATPHGCTPAADPARYTW